MISMLSGSFLNIALDYVFVFPCNMGMFGAALATGFAPMLGVLLSSVHFLQRKNTFRLVRALPSFRHLGDMCALGSVVFHHGTFLGAGHSRVQRDHFKTERGRRRCGVRRDRQYFARRAVRIYGHRAGLAARGQPLSGARRGEKRRQGDELALLTAAGFALSAYLFGCAVANPFVNIFNRDNDAQRRRSPSTDCICILRALYSRASIS